MLTFLEYFSILLASAAGVLALLTEFKTSEGEITYWGKVALSCVLIAALVSTTVKYFKDEVAREATLTELNRANASLFLIKKSLYPLREYRTEAEVSYSLDHPYLSSYAKEFRKISNSLRMQPKNVELLARFGVDIFSRSIEQENNWMRIYPKATIIKPFLEDRNARSLIDHIQLVVRIISNPERLNIDQINSDRSILNFTYYGRVFEATKENTLNETIIKTGTLLYNFSEDRFYISTPDIPQEITYIKNNATSFLDLLNSTITIRSSGVGSFTNNSRIERISMTTPVGHQLTFKRKHFALMSDNQSYYFVHHTESDEGKFFGEY